VRYPVAFQIYSSRLFPPIEAHLPKLKAMGYDAIEPWPPAYIDDPAAFRARLDENELGCIGFHMPLSGLVDEPDRFIDIALTLGARYLIPPFVPEAERRDTRAFWQGIGRQLAAGAKAVGRHGLKVAWHNHAFEYVPLSDGSRPIDHSLDAAGPAVGFEIDCGWITRAGVDPAGELRRYADRIVAIQVKDMAPPGTGVEDGWAATGDGIIAWAGMVDLFRATAADHIVTEHDNPADWEQFADRSLRHVRGLGL